MRYKFDKEGPTPETFSPGPTPRWSGLPSDMVGCRGTVHHRTCNADGSEQRDMGH
jgi:hypothetical protein